MDEPWASGGEEEVKGEAKVYNLNSPVTSYTINRDGEARRGGPGEKRTRSALEQLKFY